MKTLSLGREIDPSSFAATLDEACDFQHEILLTAYAYWMRLAGERPMPTRQEIKPNDMRSFLAHVAIVDAIEIGGKADYFVRVAGTAIERVFGHRSGRPLLEGVPAEFGPRWRGMFDFVRETGKPVRVHGPISYESQYWLEGEYLLAPLGEGIAPSSFFYVFAAKSASRGSAR